MSEYSEQLPIKVTPVVTTVCLGAAIEQPSEHLQLEVTIVLTVCLGAAIEQPSEYLPLEVTSAVTTVCLGAPSKPVSTFNLR